MNNWDLSEKNENWWLLFVGSAYILHVIIIKNNYGVWMFMDVMGAIDQQT